MLSLGFGHAGKHRNKNANLWQQGDIRIVLNEETDGHAGSAWTARGTSVCDIGINVASAADVIRRATGLGVEAFHQPRGPGELNIPAIRGLSGSVLHFIDMESGLDQVWRTEFNSDAPQVNAGLTRIDHIAQTMTYEDMLSWTLFYTSIFDMRKLPMVDVFDPDGLVRSQVVEGPDGGLRVTLNGADTHRTLAGSFLADTFGASVQHVALASDDIFASLTIMSSRGFEPLPIPSNYYDDLAARFDLPEGLLSAMKAANVMYDRDQHGQFFQCYAKIITGGMFFEIVQRDPGYKGYGGPNAPFRIAAQKRLARVKGMPKS